MDCPGCGAEMEGESVFGIQSDGVGVGISWEECPSCGYVVDDMGNHIPPDEQRPG